MKGTSHPRNDVSLNPSGNPSIHDVIEQAGPSRRQFIQGGVGGVALAAAGGLTLGGLINTVHAAPVPGGPGFPGIGFESVPVSLAPVADRVTVPAGYTAQAFVAWGDPIMAGGKPFAGDASETAADQARQFGAHNDGMAFFPFTGADGKPTSDRGILAINNEYTPEEILTPAGVAGADVAGAEGAGVAVAGEGGAAGGFVDGFVAVIVDAIALLGAGRAVVGDVGRARFGAGVAQVVFVGDAIAVIVELIALLGGGHAGVGVGVG